MCAGTAHILQSVCFEPKAHNRLCTILSIALGLVVSRDRSALKQFPCPLDHSCTACWLLRAESCALELHTPSKCVFRAQSPQPIVHDPRYSTRIGCPKRPKLLKDFPCPLDHSGTAWWLLRVESCALELHTSSKCVFRAQSPQPIVHDPQYSTRIGCLKRPKHLETLSMSIGPFWYRLLATSS